MVCCNTEKASSDLLHKNDFLDLIKIMIFPQP